MVAQHREVNPRAPIACLAAVVCALMVVPPATSQEETAGAEPASTPVFTEEVEVNVVNIYVTVVDRKGAPVKGLTAADFRIEEGGEPMEITNFSAIGTVEVGIAGEAPAPGSEPAGGAAAPAAQTLPVSQVAVVFDNTGLEKRQRKRVLKALVPWAGVATASGSRLMVATLEPELTILQPFTSDPSLVISAFEEVAQRDSIGDMIKSNKRLLVRNIQSSQTVSTQLEMPGSQEPTLTRGGGSGGGSGTSTPSGGSALQPMVSGVVGEQQARGFLGQIEALRQQEYARVGQTLVGMDKLVRGLTGLSGRKDVLWVTEDLMVQPGLDVYEVYFTKFSNWSKQMNLDQPQLWATEVSLEREFQYIAGVSQIAETVLHVVDASDRDREVASSDFGSPEVYSQMNTDPRGTGATGGYDFSATRSLSEGSQYLAGATGGSSLGGTRNFDDYFSRFNDLVGSYYSIGYRRPGEPDGGLHDVTVKVNRDDLKILTHERVPNPTADQRLSDIAISRLLIDEGPNPLELSVSLGPTEPAEDDRYIQEVRLRVPARKLLLVEDGDNRVCTLSVAVVAADADGNPLPPRMLLLTVKLPTARITPDTVAMARLRLLIEQQSSQLAVAVRDQRSGTEASALVKTGA
jgi:VWFA-related protein